MNNLSFFKLFLSLIFKIRLIFLLAVVYVFCNVNANYLSLNNEKLMCVDKICDFDVYNNYKFQISKDNRIIELFDKSEYNSIIAGYLFYTTDIINVPAYSGKPLEVLLFLSTSGIIIDLKLIKHSEPILLTGIPVEKLLEAVCFYKGKNVNNKISIGEDNAGGISVPIIAGATVTSLILHETILESSRDVGAIFGFIKNTVLDGALNNKYKKYSWKDLIKYNAIKHYVLDSSLHDIDVDFNNLLIDMYFADLLHPSIGKNLLGEYVYNDLFNEISGKSAILILNNGTWSFKGSGFVRGGIFDRFRIEQDGNIFTFRDTDFKNLYELELIDVDDFREVGIFVINNAKYKPYKPWNLVLLLNYKTFSIEYKIPDMFCISNSYPFIDQWTVKFNNILFLLTLWIFVIFVFIFRDFLVKNKFFLDVIYIFVLLMDIYVIGYLLRGQPSVVNLFALREIKTFLWDPYLFIGWVMILFTVFLWGKAFFCGWICPFGALQEIFFRIKSVFFVDRSLEFSNKLFLKLKYFRYFVLCFLIVTCIYKGVCYAEILAEIEPFKTTWSVGILNRAWFSIYVFVLLFISVFTYRFFCRFICPLGAFLSILSIFSVFKLKRRVTCGFCKICEVNCNSRAIDNYGKIDSKECFGCFTCINNMYNKKVCPPLISKKIWQKYEAGTWLGL